MLMAAKTDWELMPGNPFEDRVRALAARMMERIDTERLLLARSERVGQLRDYLYDVDGWCARYANSALRLTEGSKSLTILDIAGALGYLALALDILGHDVRAFALSGLRLSGAVYPLSPLTRELVARPPKCDLLTLTAVSLRDSDGVPWPRDSYRSWLRALKKSAKRGYVAVPADNDWLLNDDRRLRMHRSGSVLTW